MAAFMLYQNDRSPEDEHPIFFGLQSEGEPVNDLEYWFQSALVRGRDKSEKLRGAAVDLGLTYEFDWEIKPSVALGYAFGSGDDNPNDNREEAFRQTGFQDNSDKFNGVARFKYYGEVLDPEISNLSIFTSAAGIRPTPRSSLDLVYHYFLQEHAAQRIREAEIDARPSGLSRDIGSELDFIAGYREIENIDVKFVLGYLFPGNAFPTSNRDGAFLTNLELRYNF